MTSPYESDLRQGGGHAALLIAGALIVVVVGVTALAVASPPRGATIVVSFALAGCALCAPPSRFQITSRVAGIAALAIVIATISLVVVDRPPPLDVDRVAGASALSTSVRVAQAAFASSDTIVVADPSAPPGLVLSTALARSAPVLYVHGRSVPGDVVKEIARLGSDQAVAIALDDVVLARLAAVGLRVETVAPFAPAPSLDLQLQLLEDTDHETIWVGAEGRPADLVVAAAASFPDAGFAIWRKGRPIDPSEGGARLMLVGGTAAIPGDAFDS